MPAFSGPGHGQVLEIEYLGPWITEIRNPGKSGLACQLHSDDVHGLRRSGAHNKVHRVFLEVFLQEFHGRSDPQAARIGTEEVASHPHRGLLCEGLVLRIDGIHLHRLLAVARLLQELLVEFVRLGDMRLYDFSLSRHLSRERLIHSQLFRIFRSIYHRLPAL